MLKGEGHGSCNQTRRYVIVEVCGNCVTFRVLNIRIKI